MKIVYRKSDLNIVSSINDSQSIGEIEEYLVNCFGGKLEDFHTIQTSLQRFHLEKNEDGDVVAIEDCISINDIRSERNRLLSECDWTQLQDSPLSDEEKLSWQWYRQSLRDFPGVVDLSNVVWPEKP